MEPVYYTKPYIVRYNALHPGRDRRLVQLFLEHVFDHDGHMPIGEHIYLKLKAQSQESRLTFEEQVKQGHEPALALMMFAGKEVGLDEAPGIDPGKELLLLGYLQLLAQPAHAPSRFMIELVVHPHHRTEGIGRRLYEKACELAYHCDIARVDVWAYHFKEGSPAGQFAESLGMHPSRRLFHLRRSMLLPLPVVEIPQGFMLRAFRPGLDNAEWLELNRLIFAAHPENGSWTETDLKQRFEQSWFNPQDFLVLEDATGRMAGFHWTKLHAARLSDLYPSPAYLDGPSPGSANPAGFPVFKENLGEVYVVGIHPLFQNSGLGKYLTVAGIAHLKKRGATTCGLYVDSDNLLAVTLYEKLGFQLHHVDVAYSIPLKT